MRCRVNQTLVEPPVSIHKSLKMKICCAHLGALETWRNKRNRWELTFVVSCIIFPVHAPWFYPNMLFDNMQDERLSSQETHQASVHEGYHNTLKEWFREATRKAQRDHMAVEWCIKTTLSDDKSRDLTAFYVLKQQSRSKSFPNPLMQMALRLLTPSCVAMRSPFNLDKQKVKSLIYLHLSTYSYSRHSTSPSSPGCFVWCSQL